MKLNIAVRNTVSIVRGIAGSTIMFTGRPTIEIIPENLSISGSVNVCVASVAQTSETISFGTCETYLRRLIKISYGSDRRTSPRVAAKLIWKDGS
jgi:hypothetical protein